MPTGRSRPGRGSSCWISEQTLPLARNTLDHQLDPGEVGVFVEPSLELDALDHPIVGRPALLKILLPPASRRPAPMTGLADVIVEAMQMDEVEVGIEAHRRIDHPMKTRLPA